MNRPHPLTNFSTGYRMIPDSPTFARERVPQDFENYRQDMNQAAKRGVLAAIPGSDYTILPKLIPGHVPAETQVRMQGDPWMDPNYRPPDTLKPVGLTYKDRLSDQYAKLFGALGSSERRSRQLANRMTNNPLTQAVSDFAERPVEGTKEAVRMAFPFTSSAYDRDPYSPLGLLSGIGADAGLYATGTKLGGPMITEGARLLKKSAPGALAMVPGLTANPSEAQGSVPTLVRTLARAAKAGKPRQLAIMKTAHIKNQGARAVQQHTRTQNSAIEEIRKLGLPDNVREHAIDLMYEGVPGEQFIFELKKYLKDVAMGNEELMW